MLLPSHAPRSRRRKGETSSCKAEDDTSTELAIQEVPRPGFVPSLKPLPLERNTVYVTSRLGLAGFVPGAAVHLVASMAGLVPLAIGYTMGKFCSLAGYRLADSPSFKAGCYSFLYANGIFPTVLYDKNHQVMPLDVEDPEAILRSTPFLVANHVSYLDALVLPLALQLPKFMSMASVRHYPLLGSLGEDLDFIWVNRGSKGSRSDAMQAIQNHVENWNVGDRPLMIFPEGTTSNGTSLLEFKQGAFVAGVPVRPVLLKHTGSWDPAVTDFLMTEDGVRSLYSDGEWAMNFWANLLHSSTILICEPYIPSTEEKADASLYASNVRQFMLEKHRELELICRTSTERREDVLREWRRHAQLQRRFVTEASEASKRRLRIRLERRHHRHDGLQEGALTLPHQPCEPKPS